jgi:hypothetical protein
MFLFKVQLFQIARVKQNLLTPNLSWNMLYDTKYCWQHITKLIASIVAVVQHVCQVTLSTSLHTHQPFVYSTKYCWRHITKPIPSIVAVVQHVCEVTLLTSLHTLHINHLYTIPSIVGSILQSRYQVLLAAKGSSVSDFNCVYNEIYE